MNPRDEHSLADRMVSYTQSVREFVESSDENPSNKFTMSMWDNAHHYGTHNFVRLVDEFFSSMSDEFSAPSFNDNGDEVFFTSGVSFQTLAYFVSKVTSMSPRRYMETFGASLPPMAALAFMCEVTLAMKEDANYIIRVFSPNSKRSSEVPTLLNSIKNDSKASKKVLLSCTSYSQHLEELQDKARKIKNYATSIFNNPVMAEDFRNAVSFTEGSLEHRFVNSSLSYVAQFKSALKIRNPAGIIAVLFCDSDNSFPVLNHAIASMVWLMCRNGVEFLTERVVNFMDLYGLAQDGRGIFRFFCHHNDRLIERRVYGGKFKSEPFTEICTTVCGGPVDLSQWDTVDGLAHRFDFTAFNPMSTVSNLTTQDSLSDILEFMEGRLAPCVDSTLLDDVKVAATAVYCNIFMSRSASQVSTSSAFWSPRREMLGVGSLKSVDSRAYESRLSQSSYDRLKFIGGGKVALNHIKNKTEESPRGFAIASSDYVMHMCAGSFKTSQGYGPASSRLVSYGVGARPGVIVPLTTSETSRRRDYAATFGPLCSVVGSLAILLDNEAFDALEAVDHSVVETWARTITDAGILTVYSVIPATTMVEQRYYFAYLLTLLDDDVTKVMDFIAGIASVEKYLPTPGVTYFSLLYVWCKEEYDNQIFLFANSPLSVVKDIVGNYNFIAQEYSEKQSSLEIYSRDVVAKNFHDELSVMSISAPTDKISVSAVPLRASRYEDGEWRVLEYDSDLGTIRDNDVMFFEPLTLEDVSVARTRRMSMGKNATHNLFDVTLL